MNNQSKEWTNCAGKLPKHTLIHRYINSDGIVIHSNVNNLKTSFKYTGEIPDYKRTERLLSAFGVLRTIKKESKTEIEYFKNIQQAELNLIGKKNPSLFMLNQARSIRKRKEWTSYLKGESFLYILTSSRYKILDWDVEIQEVKGKKEVIYNFMVKLELFLF